MGLIIDNTRTNTVTLKAGDDPVLVATTGAVVTNTNLGIDGPIGTAWTVTNQGNIQTSGPKSIGVLLRSGGTISNAATGRMTGTYYGANIVNGFGRVENLGTIAGTDMGGGAGVLLNGGGTIVNGAAGVTSARIDGGNAAAAYIKGGTADRVTNFGTIVGRGDAATGVALWTGGTVENLGAQSSITAPHNGVGVLGGAGSITNAGRIQGKGAVGFSTYGVYLGSGGTVTNLAGGSIEGGSVGIQFNQFSKITNHGLIAASANYAIRGGQGDIVNTGTITGLGTATGSIRMPGGGTITNSGFITGNANAISTNGPTTVVNTGHIQAFGVGVISSGSSNTVTNFGTIEAIGGGGNAVQFMFASDDRVVMNAGAKFIGAVVADLGADTLQLTGPTPGTLSGLGTAFQGFERVEIDTGASWTIAGAPSQLTTSIHGFDSNDSIRITGAQLSVVSYSSGVLQLSGSQSLSLNIPGVTSGSFVATPDGAGGTSIRNVTGSVVSLSTTSVTKAEGLSGTASFVFTATRSGATADPLSIGWSVAGIGANAATASDFAGGVLPSGTLNFAAGATTGSITVDVQGDAATEANEGFRLSLGTPPAGSVLGTSTALGTITNDDSALAIVRTSGNKPEGTGSPSLHSFTITRTGATTAGQTVKWTTAGASPAGAQSAAGTDFTGGVFPSDTVTFAAGDTSKVILVSVVGDSTPELNETFEVSLANPSAGVTIATPTATSLILNDDVAFAIAAGTASGIEGQSGSRAFTFVVQRAGAAPGPNTVSWSVLGTGAAPAGASDFVDGVLPGGLLSFGVGETFKTITVPVRGDTTAEADEGFQVTLANPTGAVIAVPSASMTILNDDTTLSIAALSASKPEGSGGTTGYTFTVRRTGITGGPATVGYSVSGIAGAGTQPAGAADFANSLLPSGIVSFAAGETSKVISIPVLADQAGEFNERFAVTLSNPSGASLGTASAQGIILNDDTSVAFATRNVTRYEGNAGTTAFTFTISRSGTTTGTSTVDWSFAPGGVAGTAAANAGDFFKGVFPTGDTITFLPGQTSATRTILVAGDTNPDGGLNESFTLSLAHPSAGVAITGGTATGTILDNDTIRGTAGNDTLTGTAGPDLFLIGQGQDTITAGGGVDGFRFIQSAIGAEATHRFTLADFAPAAGERIDLSRIDAIAGTLANDPFVFTDFQGLFGMPGQLRWERVDAGHVLIQGSVNGDNVADLTILVASADPVSSGWFVL